jgi:hypothetical protein
MEILINKLKELIKVDEQIGTPKDNYSWTKQQGVLITSREAEQIVDFCERMAKTNHEDKAALPLHGVIDSGCSRGFKIGYTCPFNRMKCDKGCYMHSNH